MPIVMIRPGVVEMNHRRGDAGSAGERDPGGSVVIARQLNRHVCDHLFG